MAIDGNRNNGGTTTSAPTKPGVRIGVSPLLAETARKSADEVYASLKTAAGGLSQAEAEERLARHGPNEIAREKRYTQLGRLWLASRNPLVVLLTVLAVISFVTGDFRAGTVMVLMVLL